MTFLATISQIDEQSRLRNRAIKIISKPKLKGSIIWAFDKKYSRYN